MITGLEELILKCPDDQAKQHIQEAFRCYEGGAYRAAIISAYISVCYDLIDKLHVLASAGDADAKTSATLLSNLQTQLVRNDPAAMPALLNFERNLLEMFRDKFEFFGIHEFEELKRLRHDRNRCAHPTYVHSTVPFQPSAELARLHIRNALVLVLTQHPRQGRAALNSLQAVVLSPYFPTDKKGALERLKGSEIAVAKDSLVKAFVDELMFGWPDSASPYHKNSAVSLALYATLELNRATTLPRLVVDAQKLMMRPESDAVTFGLSVALLFAEVGEMLDNPAKAVAKSYLNNPASRVRALAIRNALKIEWLRPDAEAAILTLSSSELSKMSGDIPALMVSRAAEIYAKVSTWAEANKVSDECAIPFAEKFSLADITLILKAAANGDADLQGSGGFRRFIDALYERNAIQKDELDTMLTDLDMETYVKE